MKSYITSFTALALSISSVDAFWRMGCSVVQTGRIDPLVNPGAIAAHAHTIVGGSNIGINATYKSLINSACTSCEITSDKSAYWTPLLYYQYPNGSFIDVPHGGSVVYYLGRGPLANTTIPFPKGFMILSGDKSARSYDNATTTWGNATYPGRPVADRVSFACLAETPLPETPYMATTDCINGLRAQIHFQSCWNGVDLYKADNSHVAYQSSIDNGICPPGYPIQIPHIFMETNYAVAQVPDQVPGGRFVFSQGDTTGYGFHGDFQNGWDVSVQADAVRNCLVPDNLGLIDNCPSLLAADTNGYAANCPEMPPQIGEPVHGLISKLPGCVNITSGPAAAPAASMNCGAGVPQPSITKTIDSMPRATNQPLYRGQDFGLVNQIYLGCYNDSAGGIRTLNALSTSNYAAMSVEYCQAYCKNNGYRLSGVEYAQECHCDNLLNPTAIGGSNQCSWNCGSTMLAGGAQEICGGYGYISVYNNTDPSFNAYGSIANTGGNDPGYTTPAPFGPTYQGCYTDTVASRTLTGDSTSSQNMTIEACKAFCAASNNGHGFQYYGVEFADECYCGNNINSPSVLLTPTSTPNNGSCNNRCKGNNPEICGGDGYMSLYKAIDFVPPVQKSPIGKYIAKGCLADPNTQGRSLEGASMTNPAMTEEMCVKYCLGRQYHYAGMEYADECYCGNSVLTANGGRTITCDKSTQMLCPGNFLEYCGGPGFMNLYYSATL